MKLFSTLVIAALLTAGCGRSSEDPTSPSGGTSDTGKANQDDVLVTVNGHKLLRSEAEKETNLRMLALRPDTPAEEVNAIRKRMFDFIVDQYIMKTLLTDEADRLNLGVSKAEEEDALAKIATRLPPGKTVDQIMNESPVGKERMMQELRTGLRVEKLLSQALSNRVSVTDAEVAAARADSKGSLDRPQTVKARHILIASKPDDPEESRTAAREKTEGIRKELVDGADFAKLASEHSDCPSKARGGDLGEFPRGRMVKAFEDAAFSQEENAIGEVVETPFGYHIIQVTGRAAAKEMTDGEIRETLQRRKRDEAARDFFQEIRTSGKIEYGAYKPPAPSED
ncbi:MAG: hypothetical protein FJ224_01755 [Lentisphaerae bacterium]|nr:hypothetical protein [Lentisphaerota bacterium]